MIDRLKEQVRAVLEYSQPGLDNANIEQLIADWAKNKQHIYQSMFKNKWIYEHPEKVCFHLDPVAKELRYGSFLEDIMNLMSIGWEHPFMKYLSNISSLEFYTNVLSNDYYIDTDKKIQKGTKIIKSFKYFIEMPDLLFELQNRASALLQEDKIEGYLCFSIHPLDFLSSSENNYNWRSCHALDGEYRAGTLSYMTDASTIVVYLRSEDEVVLPRFPQSVPWNNKKWRCLIHFNTGDKICAAIAGRQYPFFSSNALDIVRDIMINMLPKYRFQTNTDWSHWHNDFVTNFHYAEHSDEDPCEDLCDFKNIVLGNRIYGLYDIVKTPPGARHFNDLLCSSVYVQPYYMFKKYVAYNTEIKFEIGNPVMCLRCGEHLIADNDTMMCGHCEAEYGNSDNYDSFPVCDCCGSRFPYEEGYWVDDYHICEHCYNNETWTCPVCGELRFTTNRHFNETEEIFMCGDCADEREEL